MDLKEKMSRKSFIVIFVLLFVIVVLCALLGYINRDKEMSDNTHTYTVPVSKYIIVDGFHRYRCAIEYFDLKELPIVVIDKDLKEYKFLNKIKNPIIRNLLMKIADINNPRMHQYFVDDLLTTSDPEIKLYKFNS